MIAIDNADKEPREREISLPYRDPMAGAQDKGLEDQRSLRGKVRREPREEGSTEELWDQTSLSPQTLNLEKGGKGDEAVQDVKMGKLRELEERYLDQAPSLEEASIQAKSVIQNLMDTSEERQREVERRRIELGGGRRGHGNDDGDDDEEEEDGMSASEEDEGYD